MWHGTSIVFTGGATPLCTLPGRGVDVLHVHIQLIRLVAKQLVSEDDEAQKELAHLGPPQESGVLVHLLGVLVKSSG